MATSNRISDANKAQVGDVITLSHGARKTKTGKCFGDTSTVITVTDQTFQAGCDGCGSVFNLMHRHGYQKVSR
jgi:hypothetical protein